METEKLKRKIVFKIIFYIFVFTISLFAAAVMQNVENANQAKINTYKYTELC